MKIVGGCVNKARVGHEVIGTRSTGVKNGIDGIIEYDVVLNRRATRPDSFIATGSRMTYPVPVNGVVIDQVSRVCNNAPLVIDNEVIVRSIVCPNS